MFAIPQLRLIFLSLFISSVLLPMKPFAYSSDDSSEDYPIKFTKKIPFNSNPYKSRRNFRDEKIPTSGEQPYRPKGRYNKPNEINSNYKQFIETAPDKVTLKILCLKDPEIAFENSYCKKLLLHGLPGNGKTSLAKAIGLETYGKYYYIDASSLLTKWKNCHEDLKSEIQPLIDKGEPIVIIWDEINCITDQYKNNSSSDSTMPAALWSLFDYCEEEAPFLFMIGTTNNHPDDFPKQLTSRFGKTDRVLIPCPDFITRQQIMNNKFKSKQSNLTDDDKNILLEQLEGRSCRDIVKILDLAIAYSVRTNKVITRELVDLSIEEYPLEPSEYQRLAQILNTTENEIQQAITDKVLLEKNREIVDFIIKKKGIALQKASLDQANRQYNENREQTAQYRQEDRENNNKNTAEHAVINLTMNSINRSAQVNASVGIGGANVGGNVTHQIVLDKDYETIKHVLSADKKIYFEEAQARSAAAQAQEAVQAQQNQPDQQDDQKIPKKRSFGNKFVLTVGHGIGIGAVGGGAMAGPIGIPVGAVLGGVVCAAEVLAEESCIIQ